MNSESLQNSLDFSQDFSVDGKVIRVNSRTLRPPIFGPLPENPIVIFPGWGNNADSKTARAMGQAFANEGRREVIVIDTKPAEIFDGSLITESQAVVEFLKNKGIKNTTIVGYSEGGIKATNSTILLEKAGIEVDGLVLLGSAGLYKRKQSDPISAFFRHGIQNMKNRNKFHNEKRQETSKPTNQRDQGMIGGQRRELARTKHTYPKRLAYQVREISRKNNLLSQIKVPVVLINGADDLVSEPEKFLPGFRNLNQHEREETLRKTIFQSSPYVRFVTGKKPSIHTLPTLKPSSVARASLGLIRRARIVNPESIT